MLSESLIKNLKKVLCHKTIPYKKPYQESRKKGILS